MSNSRFYAMSNSYSIFLENKLGFLPDWWVNAVWEKRSLVAWIRGDKRIKLSSSQIKELVNDLFERKGVIIEPNDDLFNLKYTQGREDGTVAVYCPDGFPVSCIKGILPLGKLEEKIIARFLN